MSDQERSVQARRTANARLERRHGQAARRSPGLTLRPALALAAAALCFARLFLLAALALFGCLGEFDGTFFGSAQLGGEPLAEDSVAVDPEIAEGPVFGVFD